MEYGKLIEQLEATDAFQDYRKNCPEFYLVHVFAMNDQANKGTYQIGYLNPKNDRITTFTFSSGNVEINPESEVLKEPESTIFPLDVSQVQLTETEVLKIMSEFAKSEYPKVVSMKQFYILQHLDIGQVFNCTFLTQDFKTLNLKIDASSGEVLRHSLKSLVEFDKPLEK